MTARRRRSLRFQTKSRSQEKSRCWSAIARLHRGIVERDSPSSVRTLCPMRESVWAAQTATCLRLTHSHHDLTFDLAHRLQFMVLGQSVARCTPVENSCVIAKARSENLG